MKKEYYSILGVDIGAELPVIKKAFRKLAKENHPDKFLAESKESQEAAEKMKLINEAYNTLKKEDATRNNNRERGHSSFNSRKTRQKNSNNSFSSRKSFASGFGAEFDSVHNKKSASEIFYAMNKRRETDLDHLFKTADKGFKDAFGKEWGKIFYKHHTPSNK